MLSKWDAKDGSRVLQVSALEAVVEAMVILDPKRLPEVSDYLSEESLARPGTIQSLLCSILKAGRPELAQEFLEMVDKRTSLNSSTSLKLRKLILGKFAARCNVAKVKDILSKLDGEEQVLAANAAIRGFLEGGHKSMALQQLEELTEVQVATISAMLAACNEVPFCHF